MLTADSSLELRRFSYELEGHLARYPHSVEARELQDQLKTALRRAERYERPPVMSAPAPMKAPGAARSNVGVGILFIGVIVVLIIVHAALRYFRVL